MVDREYFAVYIVTVYIYVHASILESMNTIYLLTFGTDCFFFSSPSIDLLKTAFSVVSVVLYLY